MHVGQTNSTIEFTGLHGEGTKDGRYSGYFYIVHFELLVSFSVGMARYVCV